MSPFTARVLQVPVVAMAEDSSLERRVSKGFLGLVLHSRKTELFASTVGSIDRARAKRLNHMLALDWAEGDGLEGFRLQG